MTVIIDITELSAVKAKIIAASYSDDGRLTGVNFKDIDGGGTVEMSLDTEGSSRVSAFVWNDFTNAAPMSNKAEITLDK